MKKGNLTIFLAPEFIFWRCLLHRTTFDEAIAQGLYKRICLVRGTQWSEELEAKWRQEMVDQYGDDADEELFCNPKARSSTYIPPLHELVDGLPNFFGGAMDARGNGTALAEFAESRYGASRIDKVMPTQPWYLEAMPAYKKALEDDMFRMPYDEDLKTDHAVIKEENGVPKVPESSRYKGTDGGKRHGDGAMALVFGNYAARRKQGNVLRQVDREEEDDVRNFFDAAAARRERDFENERISSRDIKTYF